MRLSVHVCAALTLCLSLFACVYEVLTLTNSMSAASSIYLAAKLFRNRSIERVSKAKFELRPAIEFGPATPSLALSALDWLSAM